MINKIKQRSKDYFHLLGLGCHSINYWLPGKLAVLPDIRGQRQECVLWMAWHNGSYPQWPKLAARREVRGLESASARGQHDGEG